MALHNFGINDTTSVALKFELCAAHAFVWPLHKKKKNARPFVVVDVVIVGDVRKEIKFVRNPPAVLSRVALAHTVINFLSNTVIIL